MIKLLGLIYYLAPIVSLGLIAAFLILRDIEKREAAARKLREQRQREHAEDCVRAGANIRLERWKRQVNHFKATKLKDALIAGAKRIDEMRRAKKNALR